MFIGWLSSAHTSRNALIVETAMHLREKENHSKSAGWGAKTHKMPFFRRGGQWPPVQFGTPYMREADSLPYEDADALYKRRGGYYPPVKRGTLCPIVGSGIFFAHRCPSNRHLAKGGSVSVCLLMNTTLCLCLL